MECVWEKSKNNEYEGVELKVVEDLKAKIVKAKYDGLEESKQREMYEKLSAIDE